MVSSARAAPTPIVPATTAAAASAPNPLLVVRPSKPSMRSLPYSDGPSGADQWRVSKARAKAGCTAQSGATQYLAPIPLEAMGGRQGRMPTYWAARRITNG
ncbi:hypothetical protein XFLAVUS301_19170 [Xanthobacter flavus]|uniref:Uncharacterized protein n=1 Tax=Xanthobacter flavus TaxID=281 RepID=A0A9W6CH03_XANFL|nr:hypothetical protein XFLAVUS301_19170 [Xanthobacter flavus]